jgi:hypothetical protein
MRNRTYSEDAEWYIANLLAWVDCSYKHLYKLLDVNQPDNFLHVVFVQDIFKQKMNYYAERAPYSSVYCQQGLTLLTHHRYKDYLFVFPSDFPRSQIWTHFTHFLCCLLYSTPDMLSTMPVQSFSATRGQGLLSLTLAQNLKTLRQVIYGYRHCCEEDCLWNCLLPKEEISMAVAHHKLSTVKYKHINPNKAIVCEVCGLESINVSVDLTKLGRMFAKYVHRNQQ